MKNDSGKKYDYLVVGSGFFGSVFAQQAAENGKRVLIIDKRSHTGGNCHTDNILGINVHTYGAHIFHTSKKHVWDYLKRFTSFNNYINRPKVYYKGRVFSFPINMMTLHQLWGVVTPQQAKDKLKEMAITNEGQQDNFENWILSQVGRDIYEIFFKGYTLKQWNKHPRDLPSSIIRRLPIRFTYDENYFFDPWQGIPIEGYSAIFDKLLEHVDVKVNVDYFANRTELDALASKIVFTGMIDEYFDFQFGRLEYRSLRFEQEIVDGDYQGNAVINYTDIDVPYTRILEHKHFEFKQTPQSVITREYPQDFDPSTDPYYPIADHANLELCRKYQEKAQTIDNVLFGGRLGQYKYYNMDDVIAAALDMWEQESKAGKVV